MLEQNTDRLMAVVGALAVGAIIIALAATDGPVNEIFTSIMDKIKDAITSTGA